MHIDCRSIRWMYMKKPSLALIELDFALFPSSNAACLSII